MNLLRQVHVPVTCTSVLFFVYVYLNTTGISCLKIIKTSRAYIRQYQNLKRKLYNSNTNINFNYKYLRKKHDSKVCQVKSPTLPQPQNSHLFLIHVFLNTTGIFCLKIIYTSQAYIHQYQNLKRKLYNCNVNVYFNKKKNASETT